VRLLAFSLFFHFCFIIFSTYLYFLISFIYLLVLLNTMCIYPPFCNTTSSSPLPKYIGVSEQTLARRGRSTPLDFSKCYRMCANGVVTHDIMPT
jgi:hypothetical protein